MCIPLLIHIRVWIATWLSETGFSCFHGNWLGLICVLVLIEGPSRLKLMWDPCNYAYLLKTCMTVHYCGTGSRLTSMIALILGLVALVQQFLGNCIDWKLYNATCLYMHFGCVLSLSLMTNDLCTWMAYHHFGLYGHLA